MQAARGLNVGVFDVMDDVGRQTHSLSLVNLDAPYLNQTIRPSLVKAFDLATCGNADNRPDPVVMDGRLAEARQGEVDDGQTGRAVHRLETVAQRDGPCQSSCEKR